MIDLREIGKSEPVLQTKIGQRVSKQLVTIGVKPTNRIRPAGLQVYVYTVTLGEIA